MLSEEFNVQVQEKKILEEKNKRKKEEKRVVVYDEIKTKVTTFSILFKYSPSNKRV